MDRGREETEKELNKQAASTSTAATNLTATNNLKILTENDNNESCDTDTFETWTLVNDKENHKFRHNLENSNENQKRVEVLNNNVSDREDHDQDESKTERETQLEDFHNETSNDDLSDGISIISESESVDRISPVLNMNFNIDVLNKLREGIETDTLPFFIPPRQSQQPRPNANQQIRQRRKSSNPLDSSDNYALQKASLTVTTTRGIVPLVKRGLQGLFYMGVILALLGLIGKIVNPTWQPLASVRNSSPSTIQLEQKVNDMELRNNLMRAEIDLLNKQVKYLASLNDPLQSTRGKYKESKTFKAWPGNGDSLKPVDITKEDLKKPYKCPDGSFVEIANMCIERRPANEPSIVDQLGQVIDDLKGQSETIKTFEQVAEEWQGLQENPFEQVYTESSTKQFVKNKPIYEIPKEPKENQLHNDKYHKYNKYAKADGKNDDNYKTNRENKKKFAKNENKQSREYKKYADQVNVRDNSHEKNEWKSNKSVNNSKERNYRKDISKERYNKDFDNSKENLSKERYNKLKRKYGDGDGDGNSGEWQEKYMKHREQRRQQNEQKYQDNNNWYIKRGGSRENKRSGEMQHR